MWSTRTSTTSPPSSGSRPTERILDWPSPGRAEFSYAAVYPNRHPLGLANLGFQTVAALLAGMPGATCHRAFEDYPRTLEARRALGEYDAVAFSISYEGDYPTALRLLEDGGVALRTTDRSRTHPLVIAGGVAPSLNPEPLAPFFDVLFLGEAEANLSRLHAFLLDHRGRRRPDLLEALAEARLPGVYVPSRYRIVEENGAVVRREPLGSAPARVDRMWTEPPWEPARTRVWTPNDPFQGAYLLEVSRGCPHACRFCVSGYATRPARFLALGDLEPWARFGAREVGRVGLVGAAVSDHPALADLGRAVLDEGARFTVSSLRVENVDPSLVDLLFRGGLQTLTVALEAGTQRLRRVLGKNIDEADLIEAARMAGRAGLQNLRIYAMVGLPGETDEDVGALGDLAGRTRDALGGGSVTVSVAPFVPKPFTPLQWEPMAPEPVLRARIRLLQRLCGRRKGVRVVAEAPKWARVQGFLSRGGRFAAPLLERAARSGDWRAVLRSSEVAWTLDRPRSETEVLPWDFVGAGPSKEHLLSERHGAARGAPPAACDPGSCRICGVCGGSVKNAATPTDS